MKNLDIALCNHKLRLVLGFPLLRLLYFDFSFVEIMNNTVMIVHSGPTEGRTAITLSKQECLSLLSQETKDRITIIIIKGNIMTDCGVSFIASRFKHIDHLMLDRTVRVSSVGLEMLTSHRLSNVSIVGGCEGNKMGIIIKELQVLLLNTLQKLVISDNATIGGEEIKNLQFQKCSKLQQLGFRNVNISDDGLGHFTSSMNGKLLGLTLHNCNSITDLSLIKMSHTCRNLKLIAICDCSNVTHIAIDIVFQCCNLLENVILIKAELSDESLLTLAQECPELRYLTLYRNSHITYRGLQHLVNDGCSKLQQVMLSDCSNLSKENIFSIVNGLTKLKYITLVRCVGVSMSVIDEFKSSHPQLSFTIEL